MIEIQRRTIGPDIRRTGRGGSSPGMASTRQAIKPAGATGSCRASRKLETPSKRKAGNGLWKLGALAFGIVFLFSYITVYAELTMAGFKNSKIVSLTREETVRNQRLNLMYSSYCNPNRVAASADAAGLVCDSESEWVKDNAAMASAAGR